MTILEKKVYVPTNRNDKAKMHVKHDCSRLIKKGQFIDKIYVTEREARAMGAEGFCTVCARKKTVKKSSAGHTP